MLSLMQCWILLFLCIGCEVTGSVCLKLSGNYRHLMPSIIMFVMYFTAIGMFPSVLTKIDLGTAYAVWSGVGTAVTAFIGIIAFSEKSTLQKLLGIVLIIVGVIVLNFAEAQEDANDNKEGGIAASNSMTANENSHNDDNNNVVSTETSALLD